MKAAITSQETQVIDMTPIETILSDVQLQSALNDWMLSSAEERIAAATPLQKFAQEYVLEPYLQMQADALQQHWEQTRTDRVGKIEQQMTQRIAAESRQAAVDQFDIAQPGGDGWFSICTSKGVWIHAQIELTGRVNISIKDFDKKSLLRSSREHYEIQKDTIRHALDFLDYLSGHSLSGVPLVISSKVASKDPKTVHLFKQELESFSQRHQSKVEKSFDEVAEKISPRTSPS